MCQYLLPEGARLWTAAGVLLLGAEVSAGPAGGGLVGRCGGVTGALWLTAVSAVPWLMEQIDKGYMAKCAWAGENDGLLQITLQDPETEPGAGTQFLLTFDRAGYALLSAEVSVAGTTVLTAQTHDFTMELGHNETGDNADLG